MNLRDSLNNQKYSSKNQGQSKNNTSSNQESSQKEILKNFEKYKNYSHNDLMSEFIKKTTELKNKGELTQERVNEIYNTLMPMLNEEQKKNLSDLLKMI